MQPTIEKPSRPRRVQRCQYTKTIQHKTETGAMSHLQRLTSSRSYSNEPMGIFKCQCGTWHVRGA